MRLFCASCLCDRYGIPVGLRARGKAQRDKNDGVLREERSAQCAKTGRYSVARITLED